MDGAATGQILGEVYKERERQDSLYGVQTYSGGFWLSILGEEFGEVCREVYEAGARGGPLNPNYRNELIQLAAVAVQMIECYDRREAILDR